MKKGVKAGIVDERFGYKPEDVIADDLDGPPSGWIFQDRRLGPWSMGPGEVETCDEDE